MDDDFRGGQGQSAPLGSDGLSLGYPTPHQLRSEQIIQDVGGHPMLVPQQYHRPHLPHTAQGSQQQPQSSLMGMSASHAHNFQGFRWQPYQTAVQHQPVMAMPSMHGYTSPAVGYSMGYVGGPPLGLAAPPGYSWMPVYTSSAVNGGGLERQDSAGGLGHQQMSLPGFRLHMEVPPYAGGLATPGDPAAQLRAGFGQDHQPANSTRGGPQRPKLRKTCDACSKHKKACDSRMPCYRCMRRKTQCVYSMRKRTGPKATRGAKAINHAEAAQQQEIESGKQGSRPLKQEQEHDQPDEKSRSETSNAADKDSSKPTSHPSLGRVVREDDGVGRWNKAQEGTSGEHGGREEESVFETSSGSSGSGSGNRPDMGGSSGAGCSSGAATDGETTPPPHEESRSFQRSVATKVRSRQRQSSSEELLMPARTKRQKLATNGEHSAWTSAGSTSKTEATAPASSSSSDVPSSTTASLETPTDDDRWRSSPQSGEDKASLRSQATSSNSDAGSTHSLSSIHAEPQHDDDRVDQRASAGHGLTARSAGVEDGGRQV